VNSRNLAARRGEILNRWKSGKFSVESPGAWRPAVQTFLNPQATEGKSTRGDQAGMTDNMFAAAPDLDHATQGETLAETTAKAAASAQASGGIHFSLGNGIAAKPPTPSALRASPAEVMAGLPEGLRSKLIEAGFKMAKTGGLTGWTSTGIEILRALNTPEELIQEIAAERVEQFLDVGRTEGLSAVDVPFYSAEPNGSAGTFFEKYLAAYQPLSDAFQLTKPFSVSSRRWGELGYLKQLDYAHQLAATVDDHSRTPELFTQALRLKAYDSATKIAADGKDDRALITVGMLALSDYYRSGGHGNSNRVWDAIDALKRVQGEGKAEAKAILTDLAKTLMAQESEDLATSVLRALRATGTLVGLRPEDSVKVDFITEVKDKKIQQLIREVIDRSPLIPTDELQQAWLAMGDKGAMASFAEAKLQEGRFKDSVKLSLAAGDKASAKKAMDAWIGSDKADPYDFEFLIPRFLQLIGDREGLLRSKALCEKNGYEVAVKRIDEALSGQAIKPLLGEVILPVDQPGRAGSLDSEIVDMQRTLGDILAKSTPKSRREAANEGAKALKAGDSWSAFQSFLDALDLNGLVAAGDLAVKQNDEIKAAGPYIAAAILAESHQRPGK